MFACAKLLAFTETKIFACGEMKTNKQQSVLFPAFIVPRVLKFFRFF